MERTRHLLLHRKSISNKKRSRIVHKWWRVVINNSNSSIKMVMKKKRNLIWMTPVPHSLKLALKMSPSRQLFITDTITCLKKGNSKNLSMRISKANLRLKKGIMIMLTGLLSVRK